MKPRDMKPSVEIIGNEIYLDGKRLSIAEAKETMAELEQAVLDVLKELNHEQ